MTRHLTPIQAFLCHLTTFSAKSCFSFYIPAKSLNHPVMPVSVKAAGNITCRAAIFFLNFMPLKIILTSNYLLHLHKL